MKILMTLESNFPPDIRVQNEANSLLEAGHEVHIACYKKKNQAKYEEIDGIIIHRFSIGKIRHKSSVAALKFSWYFNFWRKRLSSLIRKEKYDAIHMHDLPLASTGVYLRSRYGIKLILDLHENWPALLNISTHTKSFLGKLLCSIPQWEKYELDYTMKADKIIVVVDEAKKRLIDSGLDAKKISVVSNTLNMDLFSFPKQIKDPKHVTMVYGGGVNYHRGLQYAIEAIALLKDKIPSIRLWIIGDGNYLQNLKELVKSLDISIYVKFWGWKKQQELLELLSQGDYAIIPHIRSAHTDATIPHKIFQYMYAEIPIISSDCLPLDRILKETGTGVCFKDKDAGSFANIFMDLYQNKKFLKQTPVSGKKWVIDKYNWKVDSGLLTDLYDNLTLNAKKT